MRHNRILWLLAIVPVVFVVERVAADAHTALFLLSVLAIVPLATLLSHATESVAARTGDAVGGLLNATLGNLTELVIAVTALRAGMLDLVKASIAGAIVRIPCSCWEWLFCSAVCATMCRSTTARPPGCRRACCSWRHSH